MPQVCFPFARDAWEQTLIDKMLEGTFLLGSGPEDNETAKTRRMRLHRVSEDVMPHVCRSLQEAPLGRVHSAALERRDTFTVCRGGDARAREGTAHTQNETLRHAELFPSLVCGTGVFVRPRESRVC